MRSMVHILHLLFFNHLLLVKNIQEMNRNPGLYFPAYIPLRPWVSWQVSTILRHSLVGNCYSV